jgi:hypothetical protein
MSRLEQNREPEWTELSSASPPPLAQVYARARRRRIGRLAQGAVGALAVAAAALLALQPGEGRDRGMGHLPLVELEAVAEGPQGSARPLSGGGSVGPSERVVFFARSSGPGEALLREHGPAGAVVVWPAAGSWALAAGEQAPGGEQPLSWRPDGGPGAYRYELRVCPEPGSTDCATSWLELVWAP